MELKIYEHKAQYYETDQMGIIHHANYLHWFEEARIDRLQIDRLRVGWLRTGWPTFDESRSIKGRVGNCGRVFPVAPCVLHRIELLFQWYSHWCAKKNAIGYLLSDALRGRQSAAASLLARMDYSSLCGALSLFACVA